MKIREMCCFVLLGWLSFAGCQPPGIQNIINCNGVESPLQAGLLDIRARDNYNMKFLLQAGSGDLLLQEVKVWFEYPARFSLNSLGSQIIKTKEHPLLIPIYGIYTSTKTHPTLIVQLIPTTITSFWISANELGRGTKRFQVKAHITIKGSVSFPEIVFPIEVCSGCLRSPDQAECKTTLKPEEQGKQGVQCVGQDWICSAR